MRSPPEATLAKRLRVGARSLPYLADHGFQDMVVLPGSFYIATALCAERELTGRVPFGMRNVSFQQPVILSAEDTLIDVIVRDSGGSLEYGLAEAIDGLS